MVNQIVCLPGVKGYSRPPPPYGVEEGKVEIACEQNNTVICRHTKTGHQAKVRKHVQSFEDASGFNIEV